MKRDCVYVILAIGMLILPWGAHPATIHSQGDPAGVTVIPTNNLNVRADADVSATLVGTLASNTTVEVLAKFTNEAGELWLLIPFEGGEAWIASWLVTVEGELDTVPVWGSSLTSGETGSVTPLDITYFENDSVPDWTQLRPDDQKAFARHLSRSGVLHADGTTIQPEEITSDMLQVVVINHYRVLVYNGTEFFVTRDSGRTVTPVTTVEELNAAVGLSLSAYMPDLIRDDVIILNSRFQEAFDALPSNVLVYEDGQLQTLALYPQRFDIVDGELRFIQSDREFIWTKKTGWLIEQFRTPNGVGFFLSDDFKDMESRHEAGLIGTLYDGDSTFPRAIVPGEEVDMTTYVNREDYQTEWWNEQGGFVGNREFSTEPGIPALDAAVRYTWYLIFTESNDISDMTYDEFNTQFEAGKIGVALAIDGQTTTITPDTNINLRYSPNAAPGVVFSYRMFVDSLGTVQIDCMGYQFLPWHFQGSVEQALTKIYAENIPGETRPFQVELMQIMLPDSGEGFRYVPATLLNEDGRVVEWKCGWCNN